MARISNVELSVVEDVANANIEIDYDIDWDSYDQASNQLYQENWKLVGDDTGPPARTARTRPSPGRVPPTSSGSRPTGSPPPTVTSPSPSPWRS